jgi:hypothetical protein
VKTFFKKLAITLFVLVVIPLSVAVAVFRLWFPGKKEDVKIYPFPVVKEGTKCH